MKTHPVIVRLLEIVDQELKGLEMDRLEDYNKAAWPYLQADVNGCKRALRHIKQLFKFTGDETDAR